MGILLFLKRHGRLLTLILALALSLYSAYLYLTVSQRGYDKILSQLALQFTRGHLALSIFNLPIRDYSNYYNNFYVYFGPLASILLIPGVLFFGDNFPQVTIGISSMIVSFLAMLELVRQGLMDAIQEEQDIIIHKYGTAE